MSLEIFRLTFFIVEKYLLTTTKPHDEPRKAQSTESKIELRH